MKKELINDNNIKTAMKYIDEHGVPKINECKRYEVIVEKRYPSKYLVAVANSLANGASINDDTLNSLEANRILIANGYEVRDLSSTDDKSNHAATEILTSPMITLDSSREVYSRISYLNIMSLNVIVLSNLEESDCYHCSLLKRGNPTVNKFIDYMSQNLGIDDDRDFLSRIADDELRQRYEGDDYLIKFSTDSSYFEKYQNSDLHYNEESIAINLYQMINRFCVAENVSVVAVMGFDGIYDNSSVYRSVTGLITPKSISCYSSGIYEEVPEELLEQTMESNECDEDEAKEIVEDSGEGFIESAKLRYDETVDSYLPIYTLDNFGVEDFSQIDKDDDDYIRCVTNNGIIVDCDDCCVLSGWQYFA